MDDLLPRAALFDVEGVICHADADAADAGLSAIAPGLTDAHVQATRNRADLYPAWEAHSVGQTDSATYWSAVLAGCGVAPTPEAVAAIVALQRRTAWARVDADVLVMAGSLKAAGLRIGILSNSAPHHEPAISGFEGVFDVAHFSHRTGRRKPDPAAYLAAAEALKAPPAAIVFVDDKPRNLDAAARLGMRAIHFTGAGALREALAELALVAPR